jgi:hypothetical protein
VKEPGVGAGLDDRRHQRQDPGAILSDEVDAQRPGGEDLTLRIPAASDAVAYFSFF